MLISFKTKAQKQPPEVFLKISQNSEAWTLLKKRLWHKCFPVNFGTFDFNAFMDFAYVFENLTKFFQQKTCYFSGALDLSMLQYYFRWFNTRFRWCGKYFLWFRKWVETIGNSSRGKEEKRCRSSRCVIFMRLETLQKPYIIRKNVFS